MLKGPNSPCAGFSSNLKVNFPSEIDGIYAPPSFPGFPSTPPLTAKYQKLDIPGALSLSEWWD
jgi:hypothetical protein